MPKRELPPLSALRAFEAAARRSSFKAAAAELFVTPTAISHRLRRLEEFLGVRVLERTPREVRLTASGRVLFDATVEGFEAIRGAVSAIRDAPAADVLTISSTTAFLGSWLIPRLQEIRRVLPDLELRLHASDEVVRLRAGELDLAIRYGAGPYPGVAATMLRKDLFAPVCSPGLGVAVPEDLRSVTLLHIEGRRVPQPPPDWALWSAAFGPAGLETTSGLRFTDGAHALQAAIAGQGVAIVSLVLVQDALASGLLVRPFDGTLEGECYHFVAAEEIAERVDVVALRHWFRAALG